MASHDSSTNITSISPQFVNDPSWQFDEWRHARMEEEFGTAPLGIEYFPQGRNVVTDRWACTPIMIPSTLVFDQALTDTEKLVCITLYSAANAYGYGGDAYRFLSENETLCEQFDMSPDELDTVIQKLHDMGYVKMKSRENAPDLNRRNVQEHLFEEIGYKYNYGQYLEVEEQRKSAAKPEGSKRLSRSISSSMRLRVYKHDGYQCVVCGSNEDLAVDHIVPLAKGGTNKRENLQTLCGPCNSSKGVKSMDEWIAGRGGGRA